ncbi:MAG: SMC-Scp complex subunit ScpB [Ignavibacteria bacterium]|nr:SMC-Scp complex subunit ScpB [Ignavibacteria bacterium]
MNFDGIKKIVEVLIFSSDRPLTLKQLKDIINQEKSETGVTADIRNIEKAVGELIEKYQSDEYSFSLIQIAGAYRFATKHDFAPWLAKLNKEKLKRRLSQSALETLAIISYNQPITKAEIEAVRGVNVDYIIGSLLEKDLITIRGRAEVVGRPMLYGTTDNLLEYLGINSVEDLPQLKAIDEIIKSGPPEGVSQSDIDFYEEINHIRETMITEGNAASSLISEVSTNEANTVIHNLPVSDENTQENINDGDSQNSVENNTINDENN